VGRWGAGGEEEEEEEEGLYLQGEGGCGAAPGRKFFRDRGVDFAKKKRWDRTQLFKVELVPKEEEEERGLINDLKRQK
jgi:hypothetical protein